MVMVFFIAAGEPAPHVNEQHYLTRLKHFWDTDWCRGDLFLESPDAHFTIVWLAGWITRLIPLPAVAWVGRLAAWALLAWALQRLSWTVAPVRWGVVLVAALWVVGVQQGNLAGEWAVGGVESKCFAYAFVLLALHATLQDRWNFAWVHLGAATALHALVGGWSVLIFLGLWLRGGAKPSFRSIMPGMAFGGLLGLAGVLPALLMNWGTPAEVVAEANRIYVFDRLPHHLALLSKPSEWIAERAGRHFVVLLLLAVATWWVRLQRGGRSAQDTSQGEVDGLLQLCRYAWGAAVLAMFGFALEAWYFDSPLAGARLQRYYWYRLTDVAAPLAVSLTAVAMVTAAWRQRKHTAIAGMVGLIAVACWFLAPSVFGRVANPRPPADKQVADLDAWIDACRWAGEETPADAVFLVPQYANSFKWRAGRAEVVTYKDIPQNAAGLVEWKRRFNDVFRRTTDDGRLVGVPSLGHHGAARLRELGARYNASFVLTDHRKAVSLPVEYQNRSYVIYRLPPTSSAEPPARVD